MNAGMVMTHNISELRQYLQASLSAPKIKLVVCADVGKGTLVRLEVKEAAAWGHRTQLLMVKCLHHQLHPATHLLAFVAVTLDNRFSVRLCVFCMPV